MQGFHLHYRQYRKLHALSIPLMCSCNTLIFVLPLCIQIATPQVDILYLLLYKFIYVSVNYVHKLCHVMCHCAVETITPDILWKQLKIEGFIVHRWLKDWPVAFKEMAQWIQEVRLCSYCKKLFIITLHPALN